MCERTVWIANPVGFCAGVRLAVEIAEAALKLRSPPMYALNELVHNRQVVEDFEARGVRFVRRIEEVPEGAAVLFSAHGVSPSVRALALARRLEVLDATCPFVQKVHLEVARYAEELCSIALIGHRGHEEVVGVAGEAPGRVTVIETPEEAEAFLPEDPDKVAVATQTTLSAGEAERVLSVLRRRFPRLRTPVRSDICYATTRRQQAVRELAKRVSRILVLGARNSSNTLRLAEVARSSGAESFLLSRVEDLEEVPLQDLREVGLTAGASTPESFIREVLEALRGCGFERTVSLEAFREEVRFTLPAALRDPRA